MLLTNHVLTGAALALTIHNPVLAAPLALASHFALDSIPHFGWKGASFKKPKGFALGLTDFSVALFSYGYLITHWPQHWVLISIGMFFAALPDLFYIPEIVLGIRLDPKVVRDFHHKIQIELPRGIYIEIMWASVVALALQRLL